VGKNKTCELIKHLKEATGVPEECLKIKLNNKEVKPEQEISQNGSVTIEVHNAVKL
jgi:ribosomal 50S subunit-recycling heat shock protein